MLGYQGSAIITEWSNNLKGHVLYFNECSVICSKGSQFGPETEKSWYALVERQCQLVKVSVI